MWKFFAFVMVVLLILMFIQMSTLSDEEVANIRAQVEAGKKQQQTPESSPSKTSQPNKEANQASGITPSLPSAVESKDDSAYLSMPPVIAYERFLNTIPEMNFFSEADKFINPDYSASYKKRIAIFADDELMILKDLHDLTAMEYMNVESTSKSAKITYIASSKLIRHMNKKVVVDEAIKVDGLVQCVVEMTKISGNWFINSENWDPIPETYGLSEEGIKNREAWLASYYQKRNNR